MVDGPVTEVARELDVHEIARCRPTETAGECAERTRLRAELVEKGRDVALRKENFGVLCGAASSVIRFEFVAAECADHHVMKCCAPLIASRPGFSACADRQRRVELTPRQRRRRDLEVSGALAGHATYLRFTAYYCRTPRRVRFLSSIRRRRSRRTWLAAGSIRASAGSNPLKNDRPHLTLVYVRRATLVVTRPR